MDTENKSHYVDKDSALDILDRAIGFVRNCDNKASIFWEHLASFLQSF